MNKAKIGGTDYRIKRVNELTDTETGIELFGNIESAECVISICTKYPRQRQILTEIHELFHGISNEYNLGWNEKTTSLYAAIFYAFIKDNKQLVRELCT